MTEIDIRQQVLKILHITREVSEAVSDANDRLRCSCRFYIFDDEKKDVAIGKKILSVTWYFELNKVNRMRVYMPNVPELLEAFANCDVGDIRVSFAIGLDKTISVVPIEQHTFDSRSAPLIYQDNKVIVATFTVADTTPEEEIPNNADRLPMNKWEIVAHLNKRTNFVDYFDIVHDPQQHVALMKIFKKEAIGFSFPIAKEIVLAAMKQLK